MPSQSAEPRTRSRSPGRTRSESSRTGATRSVPASYFPSTSGPEPDAVADGVDAVRRVGRRLGLGEHRGQVEHDADAVCPGLVHPRGCQGRGPAGDGGRRGAPRQRPACRGRAAPNRSRGTPSTTARSGSPRAAPGRRAGRGRPSRSRRTARQCRAQASHRVLERLREVPVIERRHRRDVVLEQSVDQSLVVVEPGLFTSVPPSGTIRGQDREKRYQRTPRPATRSMSGPGSGYDPHATAPSDAVVDRPGHRGEGVPDRRPLAVGMRGAFDLVGRSRDAELQAGPVWKRVAHT